MFHKAYSAQAAYDASALTTDFPGLVSYFPMNETSGLSVTDAVTGAVYTSNAPLTFNADGSISFPAGNESVLSSGAFTDLTTGYVVTMIIGLFSASGAVAGWGDAVAAAEPTVSAYKNGTGVNVYHSDGSTASDVVNASAAAATHAFASYMRLDNAFTADGVSDSTAATAGASQTHTGYAFSSNTNTFEISGAKIYSMAMFNLTANPGDQFYKAAAEWMKYQQVTNGIKAIYPGFKGMA